MVLVSGLSSPQEYWNPVVPELAEKATVVLEEMRRILTEEDLARFAEVLAPRFDAPEDPRTEEDYRSVTRQQVRSSRPLPRMLFVVLTCRDRARAMRPLFSERALEGIAALDSDLMSRLAASIPGWRQVLVEGSGHNIHVDKPEALITPVGEMIDEVRRRRDGSGTSLEGKR